MNKVTNKSRNSKLIKQSGYNVSRPTVFGCTILEVVGFGFYLIPAGIQFNGIHKKIIDKYVINLSYRTRRGIEKKRLTIKSTSDFHKAYVKMLDQIVKLSEDGRDRHSQLPFNRSTVSDGDKVYLLDLKAYKEVYSKPEEVLKTVARALREEYTVINSKQILADIVLENMDRLDVDASEFAKLTGTSEDNVREFTRGRYQSIVTTKAILDYKDLKCDFHKAIKAVVESKPHPRVLEFDEEFCKSIATSPKAYVMKLDGETLFLTNDTVRSNLAFLFRQMRNAASVDGLELRKNLGLKKFSLQLLECGDGAHIVQYIDDIVVYLNDSLSKRDARVRLVSKKYIDRYTSFRNQYMEQKTKW